MIRNLKIAIILTIELVLITLASHWSIGVSLSPQFYQQLG